MPINVYLLWEGQTDAQRKKQKKALSAGVMAGKVGFLTEPYHGNPYATKAFIPADFFQLKDREHQIDFRILRDNLTFAKIVAQKRAIERYGLTPDTEEVKVICQHLEDFAALAEAEAKEGKTIFIKITD